VHCLYSAEEQSKNNESDSELNARSFLDNSTILSAISIDEYIAGITVLRKELFVVLDKSSELNVYNTDSFAFIRNISINGSSLQAIVASQRYNCLYICDTELKVVYRYNLSNNVTTKWSVGGRCNGLSLTSTDNLLVTLYDTSQIKEYTPNGSWAREISLNSSITSPYHSVKLSSDRFVVSHGFNQVHRVCIVDASGGIIQCYGGASSGSDVGQLNTPCHLAVDKYGNVLVAEFLNNRVGLLSPSLTHLGYIEIVGHELRMPWVLHLDQLAHRLYIGEAKHFGFVFVLGV